MTTNKNFIAMLRKARRLISKGWTQGAVARDAHGEGLFPPDHPNAVSWCLVGAIRAAGYNGPLSFELVEWNNTRGRTQSEILACFDNSIAALQQHEG